MKHFGYIQFRVVVDGGVNGADGVGFLDDQAFVHLHVHQVFVHGGQIHFQEVGGLGQEFLFWKIGVPLGGCLEECIQYTGADAEIGVGENAYLFSYLVGYFEAYASDVVGQAVGILFDDAIKFWAVFLVDFDGQIHGNAVFLQEHHGLAHLFLLVHLGGDRHGHLFADALDFRKALRLFLDDAEGVGFEAADDAGGESRTYTLDGAGT